MSTASFFEHRYVSARIALLLAAVLLLALGPTGVAADVRIGVAGPAQGPKFAAAQEIARAVKLAAERINAEGGVLGERISVIEWDDGCAALQAEGAARALVARGAALVVGHPCVAAAIAAAKVYAAAGVVFIAPDIRHPALTDARAGPVIFRLAGRDDKQGATAGSYLAQTFAGEPVAVVRDGSLYSAQLADEALAALKQAGMANVLNTAIRGGQKDYSDLIASLKKAHVKAVLFTGYPIEGGLLLRQMREAGLEAAFVGSDALATPQFADAAGASADGAVAFLPHDAARMLADNAARARFAPHPASEPFLSAFAAVEAWADAARRAQTLAAPAVAETLQRTTLDTVLGPVSFDAKGDADVPDYDVVWWQDGAWRRKLPQAGRNG